VQQVQVLLEQRVRLAQIQL
jgi:hypothetical protein